MQDPSHGAEVPPPEVPGPGDRLEVVVEIRCGGRIKWGADGGVDFVSPVACPFNYGSVPDRAGEDGDPLDAVILGPPLARGSRVTVEVVGAVRFLDDGDRDDKLVCLPPGRSDAPTRREQADLVRFFSRYARVKAVVHRLRRRGGPTRFQGLELPGG